MYDAVVRINDSSCTPIKLELFFCSRLAQDLGWQHKERAVVRFGESPERWAGTVGIKPPHDPYLWSNVTLISRQGVVAEEQLRRSVSKLLHLHGLGPRDCFPVLREDDGDLVLAVDQRRVTLSP